VARFHKILHFNETLKLVIPLTLDRENLARRASAKGNTAYVGRQEFSSRHEAVVKENWRAKIKPAEANASWG
jgi:hypothetical protein